jgi:hypothetical protein
MVQQRLAVAHVSFPVRGRALDICPAERGDLTPPMRQSVEGTRQPASTSPSNEDRLNVSFIGSEPAVVHPG